MELSDVTWNDQAREKILRDADRVLQETVQQAAATLAGADRDKVYQFLYEHLKDRFIDFEPGPDLGKYADAVAAGEIKAGNM